MQAKIYRICPQRRSAAGHVLTSVKNEHNVGYTTPLPAGMQEVTGITVEELEPVLDGYHEKVELFLEEKYTCSGRHLERDARRQRKGGWNLCLGL